MRKQQKEKCRKGEEIFEKSNWKEMGIESVNRPPKILFARNV